MAQQPTERPAYKVQAEADLIAATLAGDIALINKALAAGANVDHTDGVGRFPLAIAAAKGDMPVVNRLLQMCASAAAKGGDGHTALYAAASRGHGDVVQRLLWWPQVDADDMGAAAVLAAQRDNLRLCAIILKRLSQVDEQRCKAVLQELQQDDVMTRRLDQAILEAWDADLHSQEQQEAELAEHRRVAEAYKHDAQELLFRVAQLARDQQQQQQQQQVGGDTRQAPAATGTAAADAASAGPQPAKRVRDN